MRICVDAMGGDYGPRVIVAGAIAAAKLDHTAITLVGRSADISAELSREDVAGLRLTSSKPRT